MPETIEKISDDKIEVTQDVQKVLTFSKKQLLSQKQEYEDLLAKINNRLLSFEE